MRTLVRPDASGSVWLHADTRQEPAPGSRRAVGTGVVLLEWPQRRLGVVHNDALGLPCLEHLGRMGVRVTAIVRLREIDAHDVVRRARFELGPLLRIDHVVWRR